MRAIAFILALSATAASADDLSIVALKKQFDYDAKLPLNVEEKPFFEKDGVRALDVTYASPKGGRVSAFLVLPTTPGPHAGIVFGHWGSGDRTEFLAEATSYARSGVVSLLVDYPWTRPSPWRKRLVQEANPEADHQAFVQAVVDLRRGIDLLTARSDVDAKRIAYVGHSFGAQWGAILSATEPRLKATVLMAGVPDQASIWRDGRDPALVEYREKTPKDLQMKYLRVTERTAAVRYVPHSQSPVLMQFAKHERWFDRAAMDRYAAAARKGTEVKWYDTGHELNDPQALADRTAWLKEKLGLTTGR